MFASFSWLPTLIFLAEMCVVTIGTLRIIFIARGHKFLAPLLGFFEVLIWLFAIAQVMQHLDDAVCFIGFSLGFTFGNFLGIWIEKKLALGTVLVRIITHRTVSALIEHLRMARFGVTCVDGQGATGPVRIILTVIKRKQLDQVLELIEAHQAGAFYAVDQLQEASEGIFPETKPPMIPILPTAIKMFRRLRLGEPSVVQAEHECPAPPRQ